MTMIYSGMLSLLVFGGGGWVISLCLSRRDLRVQRAGTFAWLLFATVPAWWLAQRLPVEWGHGGFGFWVAYLPVSAFLAVGLLTFPVRAMPSKKSSCSD